MLCIPRISSKLTRREWVDQDPRHPRSPRPDPFTFTAYPIAAWGVRARYDTCSRAWTILAAVYDGDPELKSGNPSSLSHNRHGTSWGIGDNGATPVFVVLCQA